MITARWSSLAGAHPRIGFVLQVAVTLACFVAISAMVKRIGSLPEASYAKGDLITGIVHRGGPWVTIAIVLSLLAIARFGHLLAPWHALERGRELRWFVLALVIVLIWPIATYGHNFYFDRAFAFERVLLLGLALGTAWRPVFLLPLLALAYALMWQLKVLPLGGSILAHKLQVLHVLEMFGAGWVVFAVSGIRRSDALVVLIACVVAAAYWTAFVAKAEIGWIWHGGLYHALIAAWGHGWLAFLPAEQIAGMARAIGALDWPMRIGVLVIESGCLLLLLHRLVCATLLVAVAAFHFAVFALLGFLFWTWVAVDLALLVLVLRWRAGEPSALFSPDRFVVSVGLIATSLWWAHAPALGWFDTRVNYVYRVEALLADGRRLELAPGYFAPYEDVFTMASFSYLSSSHGIVVGPYGVTHQPEVAAALRPAIDTDTLLAIEDKMGRRAYDPRRAELLGRFLERFVATRNDRGGVGRWLLAIDPPPQFWSFRGENDLGGQRIRALEIREITYLYDGSAIRAVRELEVLRVEVP